MDNGANNLPSSILGDGRKFVSLLKNYLKGLQDDIAEKLGEVTKIYNTVADTPETIDEQVHSITVEEKAVNGNISLLVKWNSDNIKKYAGAVIDIKIGDFHTTLAGFSDQQWVKHYETTKTNQYLIDNIEPGQNYLIRVRGKDVYNAKSIEAKAPAITYYVEPNKHVPRPPYEATVVFDKKRVYWSWKQYDQNQYMWTELRLDEHPGELHNRLEVTTDLMSTEKPYARSGTAYLYNKGVGNSYSSPLKLPYAKAVPHAPENVTVTPTLEGMRIHFDKIPEDCYGANVYINEEKFYVEDNTYNFVCAMGKYTIRVAYLDVFGEGESSTPIEKGTNEEIPPEAVHITNKTVFDDGVIVAKHIGNNAIVGTKIAEGAITTDKISANAITAGKIATNAITTDKIASKAIVSEHMEINSIEGNRIKASSIDADKLKANSITGDKLVVDSITGDKIKAGSVTVDKLGAGVIDLKELGSAIQGGSVRIDGTGMSVGQRNGSYTKFDSTGLVWYDSKGTPFGSVRRMVKGYAKNGDKINLSWDTTPYVMVVPPVIPILGDNSPNPQNQNVVCRAVNVSPNGFEIEAFTELTVPNALRLSPNSKFLGGMGQTTVMWVWSPYDIKVKCEFKPGIDIYVGDVLAVDTYKDYFPDGVWNLVPPRRHTFGGSGSDARVNFILSRNSKVSKKYKLAEPIKRTEPLKEYIAQYRIKSEARGEMEKQGHNKNDGSYTYYTPMNVYDFFFNMEEVEFREASLDLKKGMNKIQAIYYSGAVYGTNWNNVIAKLVSPPEILKFYRPFDESVQFLAMDFPIENYYSITRNGFNTLHFSGKGTHTYKPKGRRFKVTLIGASSAIGKPRPETSETKIVGGDISYSTSKSSIFVNGINNQEEYKYKFDDYHGSWKGNEQPEETFFAADFGLGLPWGWGVTSTPFKVPGYLTSTPNAFFAEPHSTDKETLAKSNLSPTFRMLWSQGTRMNKWNDGYFGPAVEIVGAPVPYKIHSDSHHGARGGYHREMHGNTYFKMGMSMPETYEIEIPEDQEIPEFTITIGECPDVQVGQKIPLTGTLGGRTSIEVVDTKIFEGGVFIVEEEPTVQRS